MSDGPAHDELITAAAALREQAERLRATVATLDAQADALETEAAIMQGLVAPRHHPAVGGRVLRGIAEALTTPGEVIHYHALTRRIQAAGYLVSGREPSSTVLAQVSCHSALFRSAGSRSGLYERLAA